MKDKNHLYERYPDLLTEEDNVDRLHLISALDSLYTQNRPPTYLTQSGSRIWHKHSVKPNSRMPWLQSMQRQPHRLIRMSVVIALLAIIVLAGSVFAFALDPLLNSVFNMEPGAQKVLQNNMFQQIGQSKTVHGFTVTLERAYADANRAIVGYTIVKPKEHNYNSATLYGFSLTTEQGIKLRTIGGNGYGNRKGPDADALSFDTSVILGTPKELHLHFEAQAINAAEQIRTGIKIIQVKGLFDFGFTVAFHPGRIANLHLASTVNGITETLERVVVTLSETRVYVQGNGTIGELSAGNLRPINMVASWQTSDNLTALSFFTSLYDEYGQWTVRISVDQSVPSTGGGPWVFHFVVP